MKCPRCQHENRSGAKFCEECATPLARTCSNCGSQLSATAKFCPECAHPVAGTAPAEDRFASPHSYTPKHLAEKILTSKAALEGERKQVTVLFADLKGSMELLADRDPEEARKILDPVLERMMEAVHRYEGTVNQVMGDGVMALFGAPLAHEDHAMRACYAALRMQDAVKQYADGLRRSEGIPIQIRVGLNSGEVVVRSIGSDLRMDYTAVGQTTHLAARMEQMATPGTIVLTPQTLGLAEDFVQVVPLGPMSVKGLSSPLEVFQLTSASYIRSRLQAAAARGLTRFVGRDAEMELLGQALERAGAGRGQVVAVAGEPGVGKSRLVWEFTHSHRTRDWLVLEAASVSYGKATTYFPIIELLKSYFQIELSDDVLKIREKLTSKLQSLDRALEPTLPVLLSLLDAPIDGPEWARLDPPQRRRQTLDALKRLLLRESQVRPLLLVFEDLHWIDSETQALLDILVESVPTARVLLLISYRPEYTHPWGGKTYYQHLQLDVLSAATANALLDALVGEDADLSAFKHLLIERTEGNPFFLEEAVRALTETKALVRERGAYRLTAPVQNLQLPSRVQAILAARIDRLAPEDKRLLQAAAVVGKDVPFVLLQAIANEAEEKLRAGLARLQAAEFLFETQLFPDLEYTFKHALTHEVAYNGLLSERRRALHAVLVTAHEHIYAERLTEHVERLAHHATRGALWDKALVYGRQAGSRAAMRSAYREAVACFEQALAALAHLSECRETLEQAIDLRFDLRNALLVLGESERLLEHLRAAESLARTLGDQRRLGQVSAYMGAYFHSTGVYDQAIAAYERSIATAAALGESALQVQVTLMQGLTYYHLGDYPRARGCFSSNVAFLVGERRWAYFGLAGIPAVFSSNHLALCLMELGAFAEAGVHVAEALRMAEVVNQPFSLTVACHGAGVLALRRGDLRTAIPLLERGLALCQSGGVSSFLPALGVALGVAYALCGRMNETLPLLEQATRLPASRWPVSVGVSSFLWTAEASLLVGRLEEATTAASRALEHAHAHHERGYQAHALRLLGDITACRDPLELEPAETHYRQALTRSEELGMRPLAAHCHLGLGKLYRRMGKREQAQEHLATATAMYREMDMRFWLEQAEKEMGELS